MNDIQAWKPWLRLRTLWAIGFFLIFVTTGSPWAASVAPTLTKVELSATGVLAIEGSAGAGALVDFYDLNGRRLGSGKGPNFALTLNRTQLADIPCAVRAESGGAEAIRAVKGAPASCTQFPTCSILAPVQGAKLKAGQMISFSAKAKGQTTALPLTYAWDLAGGSMGELIPGSKPPAYRRPTGLNTKVQFERDNSSYRVRFTATDKLGRRCEDAVEVAVGAPPTGLPAKVKERPAPILGGELEGARDDVVVMPFEDWTYQNNSDMRMMPNGWSSFSPTVPSLRAYAFRKDRLPIFLSGDEVALRYSAASNSSDPVGADSINSTSRNFPVTASFQDAKLKKTDWWELTTTRPEAQKAEGYYACSWSMVGYWTQYGCGAAEGRPVADEGYYKVARNEDGTVIPDPNTDQGHGAYLPGKDNPYRTNATQPFSKFVATNQNDGQDRPAAWFAANFLPLTDIDDQGRVNPYPLLRVEAVDQANHKVVAATDGVVTASRDFHCRECHAKGKVAANRDAPHTKAAFGSSPWGQVALALGLEKGPKDRYYIEESKRPAKPEFVGVEDLDLDPNNIADQEYAASMNYSSMHQFYDVMPFYHGMRYGVEKVYLTDAQKANPKKLVTKDTPRACYGCHATAISFTPFGNPWWDEEGFDYQDPAYAPNYSITMHRFHAELQWKDDTHTDIVRDAKGAFVRFDWKTKGQHNSTRTRSLFPVFDDQGRQLPMEENCLRCHSGHREQQFRDRMYTAGVTCYDCHGDMLAVGEAFPKNYLANQDKLGSLNRDDYRVPWYDQPDCGSCHVGDGNRGKDKANGFFSAGVMKTAFDPADFSATTRAIDRDELDSNRFSAAPLENYKASFPTDFYADWDAVNKKFTFEKLETKVDAPLFREGKDSHGNVACAACHGAAHSVWPNADPSANDNVTALQLQGHTGTIHECNVCHTADSFRLQGDLDGGQYSGDAKAGILGGPHNLHPVDDTYWYKTAQGDISNQDGTKYGGWHNNYTKKPGKNGEDQCAACHGADHKGTRLSKTPVDRVFDFSDFDFAKLQKVGFKSKIVKVAAGTEIGCDTCHSIETSCIGSPAGGQCGVGSAVQASAR